MYPKGCLACPDVLFLPLEKGSGSGSREECPFVIWWYHKWWWWEMCVASTGQGHTDSDLCVGRSPQGARQIWRLLLAESPGVKNVHRSLFCDCRLHCRAELCLPLQNELCLQSGECFFWKPQQEEISSSHTAVPAWSCLLLLAFHSLSFIAWSLALETFVHARALYVQLLFLFTGHLLLTRQVPIVLFLFSIQKAFPLSEFLFLLLLLHSLLQWGYSEMWAYVFLWYSV